MIVFYLYLIYKTMKSKKKEKSLIKELDAIRSLKNESIDLRELEEKMVKLIEKAAQYYQD